MFDFLEPIVELASNLFGGVGEAAGSAAQTAASFYPAEALSGIGSAIAQNPLQSLGLGAQVFSTAAPFFMGGGATQIPSNLESQLQGVAPSQAAGVRRQTVGDLQSRGLEGASPDFLANQTGLTPEELDQMMGRRGGGQ